MSEFKLRPGHPEKFFHPTLGMVDASNGITTSQAKVLEAEGRLAKTGAIPSPKKDKE